MLYTFFLGNSPTSEFYIPTFRNNVPSSYLPAYEDGTDRVFRNVGIYNSDVGELPRIKHTAFRTWQKFEINQLYDTWKVA